MIIYGEFLFLENFIVGMILLLLTAKLKGCLDAFTGSQVLRIVLASALCGVGGFIIFLPLTGLGSIVFRMVTGTLCVLVAFGPKQLIKTVFLFCILTFTSGGMVMALFLWMQEPIISHQGIIYIEAMTYLKLLCLGVLALGITYWFVKFIRSQRLMVSGIAIVIIGDKRFELNAYVDSGNALREPISGKPVMLVDYKAQKNLSIEPDRYAVIPYKAVGVENGYLDGMRVDKILFQRMTVENPYIAFYEGKFEGYEILMNKDFLEGRGL